MIAPRNYLPLVEDHHGEVRAIETDWLLAALERAAVKAGFMEWWLADHVISSVCSYLSGFYASNVVGLGRLQAAVRQALRDVGYVEIARHFEADSPSTVFSLSRCAESMPQFNLPGFYEILRMQVRTLHESSCTTFHFQDLDACLRIINHGGKFGDVLRREDVVLRIRGQISELEWKRPVVCSIS